MTIFKPRPKVGSHLKWIALRPSPMMTGTRLEMIFMFSSSVTARMMRRRSAVPSIWSIARLTVVTLVFRRI